MEAPVKSFRQELLFQTREAEEAIDITAECEKALKESGIREGLCLVFPLHTSACVFISDSDPGVAEDFRDLLARLAPQGAGYRHDRADPKHNAHSHLRASLAGHHITCPVTRGAFDFGTYHTIYYLELDGQRKKEVLIKIVGE